MNQILDRIEQPGGNRSPDDHIVAVGDVVQVKQFGESCGKKERVQKRVNHIQRKMGLETGEVFGAPSQQNRLEHLAGEADLQSYNLWPQMPEDRHNR